jgi:DNA-binding PadR family transcriptional regulator
MRVTLPLLRVLTALLDGERYGLDLAKSAGLTTGTVYPILQRLESDGWVASRWEQIDPVAEGRRPRRYFALTKTGAREAHKLLDETRDAIN